MLRWTSKRCCHRAVHPEQRSQLFTVIQLHHALCSHFLKASGMPFRAVVEPVLFGTFLLVTSLTLTFVRPTDVVEFLLHPTSFQYQFSGQVSMLFSPHSLSSCATRPVPAPAKYTPSILHTHALLLTSSNGLCWPVAKAFSSHLLGKHISCQFFVAFKYQGVTLRPLDTQTTGLAHHRSCWTSHLPPYLSFSNLFHPSFCLFMMPFSNLGPSCPVMSGQGGEFLLYFEAICFHKQGQRGCTFFCPLLLNVLSFCWGQTHCMHSPSPRWHHTRS